MGYGWTPSSQRHLPHDSIQASSSAGLFTSANIPCAVPMPIGYPSTRRGDWKQITDDAYNPEISTPLIVHANIPLGWKLVPM